MARGRNSYPRGKLSHPISVTPDFAPFRTSTGKISGIYGGEYPRRVRNAGEGEGGKIRRSRRARGFRGIGKLCSF